MEKLSGLVLDARDDHDGAVLRAIFGAEDQLPDLIKSASAISPELELRLPDEKFALVLVDDGVVLRKFACIDAGNTALSVEYFLKTGHMLPAEAQKTAAVNLATACTWYDIPVPQDLEKVALGLGTLVNMGMTAPGMARQAKMNLDASQGAGHMVVTPAQRQAMLKGAEASGTSVMPMNGPVDLPPPPAKAVIRKVGSAPGFHGDHGIEGAATPVAPDDNIDKPTATNAPRLPQSGVLRPHVAVAGKEAPGALTLKSAEAYALPSISMYPLDGYDQVKAAAQYFDEWHGRLTPDQRREFSVNLVKRAHVLRIPVSDTIEKYAATTYAKTAELDAAIEARRNVLTDDTMLDVLDKVASQRPSISPETYSMLLNEFDKLAEIDHLYDRHIPDHVASTFGVQKTAADSIIVGNDYMTVPQLKRLAKVGLSTIKFRFGHELADEFAKDPVGVFNSLPLDQKKAMMRMVSDNGATDGEIVT